MIVNTGFDPYFGDPLRKFRAALEAMGIDTNIISGVRSEEDQRQLAANRDATLAGLPLPYKDRGPVYVAAPVGGSTHQIGLGADVQPVNPANASIMHRLASQFGLAMPNWGGKDPYHVQLADWQGAAASQPPSTPWSNIGDLPSQSAMNMEADAPGSTASFNPPPGGTSTDNRQIFFDALKSTGLTSQQALGALWALGGESYSNLRTDAYNPNDPGGSIGVGQWNGPRRWALEEIAQREGKPVTDPHVQAQYLAGELTGNLQGAVFQPGVLDALKQANTPQEAARIWVTKFERPKVDNSNERIAKGGQVGTLDANGNFVLGAASAAPIPTGAAFAGGAKTTAGTTTTPKAPDPAATLGSALSTLFSGLSNSESASSLGGGVIDPPDAPAIRAPALGEDFMPPAPNPVPAQLASGLGSQLGSLAIQPQTAPLSDPSITQGAPSMTAMLGQIGNPVDATAYDPRRTGAINPNMRFSRIG